MAACGRVGYRGGRRGLEKTGPGALVDQCDSTIRITHAHHISVNIFRSRSSCTLRLGSISTPKSCGSSVKNFLVTVNCVYVY